MKFSDVFFSLTKVLLLTSHSGYDVPCENLPQGGFSVVILGNEVQLSEVLICQLSFLSPPFPS